MPKHPNYELFEEIGRGENSVVHRAWDLLLSRDVAIKELMTEPGSDGGRSETARVNQFLKEASFLAQFEHENVLRIHTVDQDRGWIVMELMKGSLANQIATQPMQPDTVRSVLRQMLSALDFLHAKDKVHGSVRPSNILINDQGTVKLSDFEASSRDGELRVPQGSKKYLAPELIKTEFGDFGPAVDLYCLGFTALELLTGPRFDALFPGTGEGAIDADVAWLRWHSTEEPMRPVREIASNIPDDLAHVIDQLLKKRVDERPENAAAVLKLLEDAPLIPVQAIEPVGKKVKPRDPAAILPSKAVKLRENPKRKTRKPPARQAPKPAATGIDRLNQTLGKPYVLWPICVGMLIAALLVGLYFKGDRHEQTMPIAEGRDPVQVAPKDQSLDVALNVFPDSLDATLTVAGQPREFDDLKLEPGEYEIVVEKNGFEPFASSFKVDDDNTSFDILLKALAIEPDVAAKDKEAITPKIEEPQEPEFIDVRVTLFPADAELFVDGQPVELNDGKLRLDPKERQQIELIASAEGYQTEKTEWSMAELVDSNYDLELLLKKLPPTKPEPAFALPASLVPKPETKYDDATGLPHRALVRALQNSLPLEMALVAAGTYQIGVSKGELRTWELPAEEVIIEQPYYIGVDEVSNAHYTSFAHASANPDIATSDESDYPVTNLSIRQAAEFCDWAGGRLPTEKEWEVAVRGGDDSGYPLPWSNGQSERNLDADKCNLFRGESDEDKRLAKTGTLPQGANALGLLHTIGNVAEWCDDPSSANQFVIKGCSYQMPPGDHVRVTWRSSAKWNGAADIGMRLLVPVVESSGESAALSFAPPSDIDPLFTNVTLSNQDEIQPVSTQTVAEIAEQFTGPAELVIDSGGFMAEITDTQFSPDGQRIAVAGGKVVRIWDVESGELLETLRGDRSRTSYGNVNAVAWSPDGMFLLVGVSDYREHGNIRVYSTQNFEDLTEVLTGHTAPCRKLAFSRDGKYLVSVDADGLILVRNWETREVLHRIPARNRDQPVFDLIKFPTDEPYLLGVDFEGPQVYSAVEGKRIGSRDNMPNHLRGWLVDIYNKLVQFPFGVKVEPRVMDFRMEEGRWAGAGTAVVDGSSRFWIRVWESRDPVSSAIPAQELASYDNHRWNITAISLQPNGTLVASGDKFGEVHVWDSKTGKRRFKFAGQGKPIYEVVFDKKSGRLAFGTQPHAPKDWRRNNRGPATQMLDLRQRSIADVKPESDLQLFNEKPSIGDVKVNVRQQDAYYLVERWLGTQVQSSYRVSSGRNPSAFTLLDQPKLGVQQPVIFGDNEGLLALWDSSSDELKRAFIGHGSLVSAISPASHGKLIATSSTDRTIRLWSLEDYVPTGIFDFKFESSSVREVVPGTSSAEAGVQVGDRIVSIDGKSLSEMFELMLLGEFDYKPGQTVPVKMMRGENAFEYEMKLVAGYDFAEPVLNVYLGENGKWIIWHPQGYYDASPGADRLIGWHLNRGYDKSASFYEVQQFRRELYRPDVIDGILETGSLAEALANLKGKNQDQVEIDFREPEVIAEHHPPSVRITSPSNRWQTESGTVTVKGEATSVNGLPLTALTLLHNGSVAKVFRPTRVNQLSMNIEFEMRLTPGANDLVLIAANAKSSSQGKHIVVDLNQPSRLQHPNAIVLAIGVSEFEEPLSRLSHAAKDAQSFVAAMKSHEQGKLYSDVKTKLLSEKVTENEILDGFQWLADNVQDGDVAMVFIASQGIVDRRDNFFIAATNSSESKARSTAVSWRDLMDTLQLDLPDCKRMVFLDLKPTENSIRPGMRNPLLDLAAPEMGTIFLSSNTLQQLPAELATADQGAFLRAVLETVSDRRFDTVPTSGDSMFNPVELAAGVMKRIKDLTDDQQQPVFFTPDFAKLANILELRN
jgi:serine/threonine protein kinase/WD40 repeat protein/formylglycine-generating enzyme required for sulfatase activity